MMANVGHLENWRPYWKKSEHWNSAYSINCIFCLRKTNNVCPNNFFEFLLPFLRQENCFQESPWRLSWKLAAIWKFCTLVQRSDLDLFILIESAQYGTVQKQHCTQVVQLASITWIWCSWSSICCWLPHTSAFIPTYNQRSYNTTTMESRKKS